jgi:hypothetical protein
MCENEKDQTTTIIADETVTNILRCLRAEDGSEVISKDMLISRLITLLDEIEDLDLAVKEDHKYFRDETRRMMETELAYLRDKKILNFKPVSN